MVALAGEEVWGSREVGHWESHRGYRGCGYLPLTRTTQDQLFPGRSAHV